jgi:uncharacterized phiE125 gp8 family phage protein
MMPMQGEAGALGVSLAELKAYLRIETSGEDAVLAGLLRSAAALCEQFIGQWLIVRAVAEKVPGDGAWRRLSAAPVVAITDVEGTGADGEAVALSPQAYAVDIDAAGEGWVRAVQPRTTLSVRYRAGMAEDLNGLPESVRHGIVRLAAEHHAARGGEVATPPAIVSALWRPWRRMRLS